MLFVAISYPCMKVFASKSIVCTARRSGDQFKLNHLIGDETLRIPSAIAVQLFSLALLSLREPRNLRMDYFDWHRRGLDMMDVFKSMHS
jgi:hypothetical protein